MHTLRVTLREKRTELTLGDTETVSLRNSIVFSTLGLSGINSHGTLEAYPPSLFSVVLNVPQFNVTDITQALHANQATLP